MPDRKNWTPRGERPQIIKDTLKKIAPSLAFAVIWTPDENLMWDGEGPDPVEEGIIPHDVDVTVLAIVDGEHLEGINSLGGVYDKPDERDPDIHGYLIQMLDEALDELLEEKMPEPLRAEGLAAKEFLGEEAERQYAISMRRHGPPTE